MFSAQKKWQLCGKMVMVANTMLLIMLQFINVSNQHVIHLKLTQC